MARDVRDTLRLLGLVPTSEELAAMDHLTAHGRVLLVDFSIGNAVQKAAEMCGRVRPPRRVPLRLDLDCIESGFDGSEPWWAKHVIGELRERRSWSHR
jgi:hypothetical protein